MGSTDFFLETHEGIPATFLMVKMGVKIQKLQNWRPNCDEKGGGVNTLLNKKRFVGRTILIQNVLSSPDLGQCF